MEDPVVDSPRLARRRAHAQGLATAAPREPLELVRDLLAVQSQELHSARLALRARSPGLTREQIDTALTADRSLVVAWLGRGTLHLVAGEDYPWLLTLTAPGRRATNRRRLGQEGVTPHEADRAAALIEASLAEDGPLGRNELSARMAAAGIRVKGQALPHLLLRSVLDGTSVMGPVRGEEQDFVLTRDWLGIPPPGPFDALGRERMLTELARRYLRAHGPATATDLSTWIGLPLRDARAGIDSIATEIQELGHGIVDLAGRDDPPEPVPGRLLPRFDPYMLGWKGRGFAVPPDHARTVNPGGGIIRATAVTDGLAVGTWWMRRRGRRLKIEIEPFGELTPAQANDFEQEAGAIARFIGLERA